MKTPDEIFADKMSFLLKAENDMSKAVVEHQRKLFQLLSSEYLPQLDVKDGIVLSNTKNDLLIDKIGRFFDRLQKNLERDVLAPFVNNLIKSTNLTAEYFVAMGFKKKIINSVLRNKLNIESRLGVTPKGKVRKGSYLHRLGQTNAVRQELADFMVTHLTGDTAFLDLQLAFRNLVIGNKRVKGKATTGALQRYFDQYAYDKFNELDAVANVQIANELNLEHFIYEGSLIATSRRFCKDRAGKAFSRKEAAKWKDDPHLIDKKNKDTYNPLIDRGRYRCRHFIKYITEALFRHLRGLPPLKTISNAS